MATLDDRLRQPLRYARRMRSISPNNRWVLAGVILLVCLITATESDVFLTWQNWRNVLQQISFVGILACGTTLLMVSGGIDLSIGSNVSFSGLVLAYLVINEVVGLALAILIAIAAATGIGVFNGVLVAHAKSHPFILTLGMGLLLQGAALLISTQPISGFPSSFLDFAFSKPLGVPIVVWFFGGIALFTHILLRHTVVGRHLYAMGGSEPAARLAGVRLRRTKIGLYALMGAFVGLTATLLVATLSAAQAFTGQALTLSAIAAVAVGGTPLEGGRGTIIGTLLGVLLIGVIGNALNLLSIDPNLQEVLIGAIIVVAVMAQRGRT